MKNVIFIFLQLLLVTGCVILPDYPSEWAEIQKSTNPECINISGTYINKGSYGKPENYSPHLVYVFFPEINTPLDRETIDAMSDEERLFYKPLGEKITHITISGPGNGSLEIKSWIGNDMVTSKQLTEKIDFTCEAHNIRLEPDFSAMALGGVFFDRTSVTVSIALDKSLIFHSRSTGAGLGFYIVPIVGIIDGWIRFPALNNINDVIN